MTVDKYPAKEHAKRTAANLKVIGEQKGENAGLWTESLVYVAGTKSQLWPYSDQNVTFRQSRYFNYLTGAYDLPDCHVTYDIKADRLTLWLPPVDEDDVMWSGLPISPKQAAAKYDVDDVKHSTELQAALEGFGGSGGVVGIEPSDDYKIVKASPVLLEALDETRLIKDEYELTLMRRAAHISDNCHRAAMSARPIENNEGHIHAEFVYHAMRQGSKFQAYDPICCSGTDCGILHYTRNDQPLDGKQLVLIDAGAEWQNYASDVTRTWPLSGEWTTEARHIYELVDRMQTEAMQRVKPGVQWEDLHILTHRILVERFLELGIFHNGTADEIMEARLSTGFYPHGLGHTLGMDTHDTAGRANYDDPDPMLRYLRIRRKLEKNMVVTVEPGCYFNEFLLKPILEDPARSKYINRDVLDRYMPVGGVRIEDDVLVTADGFENFTKITKNADEVAAIVRDGLAKGPNGFHVVV